MGNPITTAGLTKALAAEHRVMMLGGLAVISHGHSRPTYHADIWLDPCLSPREWVDLLLEWIEIDPALRFVSPLWRIIDRRVPVRSSEWSSTRIVVVPHLRAFAIWHADLHREYEARSKSR